MTGRLLVASDHVGAKYLIDDDVGFIFENEDSSALSEILSKILSLPRDRISEMGRNARRRYEETSTPEVYKAHLFKIIEGLISK